MTYRGTVQNGVVVLESSAKLKNGTEVRVRPVKRKRPKQGSAEAILQHAGIWADVQEEVDEQLRILREMKQQELRRQQERGE
jgi:hypothetical protein